MPTNSARRHGNIYSWLFTGAAAERRQAALGKIITAIAVLLAAATLAMSQTKLSSDCPPDSVCITREAAQAALQAADRVAALEAEKRVLAAAVDDLKRLLSDMRAEFARASGENTVLKQRAISDAALIELLSKLVRPKKFGILVF